MSPARFALLALAGLACSGGAPTDRPQLPPCDTPPRTTGPVYYFCDCRAGSAPGCVPGDDSSPGTSPDAPRRTLGAAHERFRSMAAGSTVALCRGGVWNENGGVIDNPACTPDDPCDYRDYVPPWGSAETPAPHIDAESGSNVFHVTSGGGYRLWNLSMRTPSNSVPSTGLVRIYGTAHDVDVCSVSFDNSEIGLLVANDRSPVPGVQVRRSRFSNHFNSAIFGGANGLTIDSNVFVNNGLGGSAFQHTIYLAGNSEISPNMRVLNNDIVNDERCNGVQLVVHGRLDDLEVVNNRIVTTSTSLNCMGIQIATGGYPNGDLFRRVQVRRNRVTTRGAGPIHVSSCVDCEVSDNVTSGGTTSMGTAGCSGNAACTENLSFLNNTSFEGFVELGSQMTGGGYRIANNAIWNSGGGGLLLAGTIAMDAGNYVRQAGGEPASAVFQDAPAGHFGAVPGGPIDDTGDPTLFSPLAIGSVEWTANDPGAPRSGSSLDAGAF